MSIKISNMLYNISKLTYKISNTLFKISDMLYKISHITYNISYLLKKISHLFHQISYFRPNVVLCIRLWLFSVIYRIRQNIASAKRSFEEIVFLNVVQRFIVFALSNRTP